jgi:hypothetical protein
MVDLSDDVCANRQPVEDRLSSNESVDQCGCYGPSGMSRFDVESMRAL